MSFKSVSDTDPYAIGGGWGKETQDEKHTERVAIIRGTDIPRIRGGNFSSVPFRYETPKKVQRRLLQPGDLVIEISGGSAASGQHTGRVLKIGNEIIQRLGGNVIPASFCRLLRIDANLIDPSYMSYLIDGMHLSDEIATFESRSTGISNFQFTRFIEEVGPLIPDVSGQREAIRLLKYIDAKIANNRALAADLEAMARAIFKSWFVDFDPVRAKMNGRAPVGMDAATAALFPDELVGSELGAIPKGWSVAVMTDVIGINPTRKLSKKMMAPYVPMANLPIAGSSVYEWGSREVGSGTRFINGDTLLARITPCLENGKTAYVDFLKDDQIAWGSTEYIVMRPLGRIPPEFAYLLARTKGFRDFAIQRMSGTSGRQRVSARAMADYKILIPDKESGVFSAFSAHIHPLFEHIASLRDENINMTQLRDTLLPRLISGKLRIPAATERVADAVG